MHKPITVGVYLLLGLVIAFTPIVAQVWRGAEPSGTAPSTEGQGRWLRRAWPLGCAGGLLLGMTLPWWRAQGGLSIFEVLGGALIMALPLFALWREAEAKEAVPGMAAKRLVLFAVASVLAVFVCFSTGVTATPQVRMTAWHHWGAYIAPAEVLLAGGRIFFDFPAQYGLGPTALIASACGANCWNGVYFIAGGAAFLFAICALGLAGAQGSRTSAGLAVVLAAVFAAALLWTTYPPLAATPLITPSVTGLRFLPALALVAAAWSTERCQKLARHWQKIGFAFYALGALWSPESLFMCTVVWGPYYCLRRLAGAPPAARVQELMWALARLALTLVALAGGFALLCRLVFGVFPNVFAYLLYMLYPPGPMPINWLGPIWFCIAALACGAWAGREIYRREGNSSAFRSLLLIILLSYAVASYAMGRSHDNNFLNLLPYFSVLLAAILALRPTRLLGGVAAGLMANLLGLLITFGWNAWGHAAETGRLVEFKPRQLIASFSYSSPLTQTQFVQAGGPQILQALKHIHSVSKDPIELVDPYFLNVQGEPAWSSMHGAANFTYLPDAYRRWFLARGAKQLHRSGWLIVNKTIAWPWVGDYQSAYDTTDDLDYGAFRLMHFTPRN